jgi:hypothetical protein
VNKLSLLFVLFSPTTVIFTLLMWVANKPAMSAGLDSSLVPQESEKAPNANLASCQRQSCTGNTLLASFTNTFSEQNKDNLSKEFPNLKRTAEGDLILEFTEEESDAAIALFGCDCVASIDALRQTRGMKMGVEGNPIPPGTKPCSQKGSEIK